MNTPIISKKRYIGMKNKIVATNHCLYKSIGKTSFQGSIHGKIITTKTFFAGETLAKSINENLDILKNILHLDKNLSPSQLHIMLLIIEILKDHYLETYINNEPILITDEVVKINTILESALKQPNGGMSFSNDTEYLGFNVFALIKKIISGLSPEQKEINLNNKKEILSEGLELQKLLSTVTKQDFLTASEELLKYTYLLIYPKNYLELIQKTKELKEQGMYFFINANIHLFDCMYLEEHIYNNPYFLGTLSPVLDNCHGIVHHQNLGKAIIQLAEDIHLPDYIKINIDENNNAFFFKSTENETKQGALKVITEKSPISDTIILKNGEKQVHLKITANQNGQLDAPSFFSAGLIRLEDLHKVIDLKNNAIRIFDSKHYELLKEYIIETYKGKKETLTFRLSEFTNDKMNANVNFDEGKESLDYLINTEQGRTILKNDIKLLLELKAQGLDVELLIPNVMEISEVHFIKGIISAVQKEIGSQGTFVQNFEIGIMVENPIILQDIENIEKEVNFLSLGVNDMTNTYSALKKTYPSFFDNNGLIDLNLLTFSIVKSSTNRRNNLNKSADETLLSSDFINFLKSSLFDKIKNKQKLRACGNIDKYMATVLVGLGLKTISANSSYLNEIYFLLKKLPEQKILELIEDITTNSNFKDSSDIRKKINELTTNP